MFRRIRVYPRDTVPIIGQQVSQMEVGSPIRYRGKVMAEIPFRSSFQPFLVLLRQTVCEDFRVHGILPLKLGRIMAGFVLFAVEILRT